MIQCKCCDVVTTGKNQVQSAVCLLHCTISKLYASIKPESGDHGGRRLSRSFQLWMFLLGQRELRTEEHDLIPDVSSLSCVV